MQLRLDPEAQVPALLAVLLIGGIAAQLLLGRGAADLPPPAGAAAVARAPSPAAVRIEVPAALAARPLFGRLGVSGAAEGPEAQALGGATIAGKVGRGGRRAAVVVQPGKSLAYLPLGGSLAGWTLTSLDAEAAGFRRGDEQMRVPYGSQAAGAPEAGETEDQAESEE
ncbi:MAG: hypothetical protein ACRC1J_05265 [Sandaracinobacteroides sp.]